MAVYVAQDVVFAQALRRLMAERYGENSAELAKAAQVSPTMLVRYLRGETRPSFDVLIRLSAVLGVGLDQLVFGRQATSLLPIEGFSHDQAFDTTLLGGMLSPGDATQIERHSVHTTIVTGDLSTDVLVPPLESSAGGSPSTFTSVVTENITDGNRYEYFVPQGQRWGHEAKMLRQVVGRLGGLNPAFVDRHLQMMHVKNACFPGFVLYQVPIERLQRRASSVFDRVLPFLHLNSSDRATGFIGTVELANLANSSYTSFALVSRENVPRLIEELHTIRENSDHRGQVKGVVVAKVVEVRPHPRAEQINLALIDLGDGRLHQVVFGGSRTLVPGDLVPAAPPGTRLPGRVKMRQRRYRGKSSFGMLCSTDELGWTSGGPNEVAVLRPDLEPGQSLDAVEPPLPLEVQAPDHGRSPNGILAENPVPKDS